MKILKSEFFTYKENKLFCENVSVEEIAVKYGSPVYIYSKNALLGQYNALNNALGKTKLKYQIYFAVKANSNINVIKTLVKQGSGCDINSAGELFRAIKAGADPRKIIFSGVGKTAEEIRYALEQKIHMLKAESFPEIILIDKIAKELGIVAEVTVRINPDVDSGAAHAYITTGKSENKFGIPFYDMIKLADVNKELLHVNIAGISMHIGSQISSEEPFGKAIDKLLPVIAELKKQGTKIEHFDIGGGLGVIYKDEELFPLEKYAKMIESKITDPELEVYIEPGRFLTANSGIFVTKLLYKKTSQTKNFFVIDGGMNDLVRPSFYQSYHHIQPVEITSDEMIKADVVGPVCESGDFLAKGRDLLDCKVNGYLAVMSAGAYGFVMSSNYNSRLRVAEIMVDGNNDFVVRKRETYEHIIAGEEFPEGLF